MKSIVKILWGCAIVLGFHQDVCSQTVYYDALKLSSYTDPDNHQFQLMYKQQIDMVLAAYVDKQHTDFDTTTIRQIYKSNPFMYPFFPEGWPRTSTKGLSALSIETMFGALGSLDVTNLADGMAKFLVKRTKQELAVTFFDRFRKAIADTNCRDLKTLFPTTYTALYAIGDQIYYYDAYIQTLRESFEKDLRDLPEHLPTIIDNHPDYFAVHPDLEALIRSGLYIANAFKNEEPFGVILREYPVSYLDKLNPDIKASIQTLRLFSESLRDTATVMRPNAYWVTAQQIQRLVTDSIAFKIYLGLLYQQSKIDPIIFHDNISFTKILDSVAAYFYSSSYRYQNYLTRLGERTNTMIKLIDMYKSAPNDTNGLMIYYQYISTGIDILESASDLNIPESSDRFLTGKSNPKGTWTSYKMIARASANLVWDVKRRSYASAIVNTAAIYSLVFSDNTTATAKNLVKYGTFMASVVQAKTSDEVESAIEATVLPAGSARIKRSSCYDISLNAYVGLYYGVERIKNLDPPLVLFQPTPNSAGLTAPIGFALSTGTRIGSLSIFLSMIDLGAVASFRFSDDSTKQIPNVQLKDIFSPGIFLSYGIPEWPISINIGAQIGSNLRTVTATTKDLSKSMYYRYSISLCVDIPIMEIFNRSQY